MRKYYLDNIRWVTVVLVVIYHVLYMFNGEGVLGGVGKITALDVQYYDLFLYAVYPWFMLLLFLVSGICSRYSLERHSGREFAKSRTRKLLIPSTIGLFVFQFIQGYVSMSISGAFDSMQEVPGAVKYFIMALSGIGVLWYIQLLWVFSMVLLLIRKIDKDRLWKLGGKANIIAILLMAVVIWGGAQILNTPVIVVYQFGYYGAAFLLGYFVFSHDEVMDTLKKYALPLIVLAAGLGIAFCAVYFKENYAEAPINRSMLFTGFGWFASMAILGGAAKYADKQNAFTAWMSKNSFGLYVFHYLGISAVALLMGKNGNYPAAVVYVICLVAGFAAGYALNAVISRLPFFRWAVLGIKKERKQDVS
ncbi:MAG: acyltransferase [Clostridia bacterium]|nr:acyltransferase [Clostridia bacterium]